MALHIALLSSNNPGRHKRKIAHNVSHDRRWQTVPGRDHLAGFTELTHFQAWETFENARNLACQCWPNGTQLVARKMSAFAAGVAVVDRRAVRSKCSFKSWEKRGTSSLFSLFCP